MTIGNGREFLSIPGPTNIPDAVLQAMHRPAIDIYSGDMVELTRTLLEDLPRLFRTSGRVFIYAANGHGGWEAAVSNVLSRGETVLVLESGVFAAGWGDMARMLGIKVEVLKGTGGARWIRPRWASAWRPTPRARSRRSSSSRWTPPRRWSTISRPSVGPSTRPATPPS